VSDKKPSAEQVLDYNKQVLDYRKNILSIIITAFGAWVGAGAAYYFGRENLRQSSESLLAMRQPSPKERLHRTPVREIPPAPIDWTVKNGDDLKSVAQKLKDEPERWFIAVAKDDGGLETVIHEQAIWRFIDKQSEAGTAYADILDKTVAEAIAYVKGTLGLDRLEGIYVAVTLDKSAGYAHELMQSKDVYLSIVTDERGKPTHYVTTGDLRNLLLQLG
jgi:hypothetical protein